MQELARARSMESVFTKMNTHSDETEYSVAFLLGYNCAT